MIEIISGFLLVIGSAFIFIASVGLIRLPDVYSRIHATTKAGTLGVGFILFAVAIQSFSWPVVVKVLLAFIFIALTAPITAHLVSRTYHIIGIPIGDGVDHLKKFVTLSQKKSCDKKYQGNRSFKNLKE